MGTCLSFGTAVGTEGGGPHSANTIYEQINKPVHELAQEVLIDSNY